MNNIEEMMQTAEVEPEPVYSEVWADEQIGVYYPEFTAEKQLELIKLIALFDFEISIDIDKKSTYLFATPNTLKGKQISVENDDFTQALLQLTTELMKANELDKEKVKGILEG